ncbi:class I SAM-dependent methyltransferase [Brachyspira intermedia]|uniref:class I SAM-dependent methyltransferase n=1 Tax=Brachyspira intermedia TaxID=84377 RepID=UPI003004CFBA
MHIQNPENFETYILDEIEYIFREDGRFSLMTYNERKFINGIIRQTKPKKILEIGMAAGGSSLLILNAIKDIKDSKLYSIDYIEKWWENTSKNIGFLVEERGQNLLDRWNPYRGGVAAKFIEEIGGDIDVCLLDSAHHNPGELLDFLMVLPFLKKNAIVIIHDIIIPHTYNNNPNYYHPYINKEYYPEGITCGALFSCLKGKKYTINSQYFNGLGNIGAVILDDNIMENLFDYFFILTFPWYYIPTDNDFNYMITLFNKYYSKNLVDLFVSIILRNKNIFNSNEIKSDNIENQLNRLVNSIAWWIPVRKWRDNFRSKILNG